MATARSQARTPLQSDGDAIDTARHAAPGAIPTWRGDLNGPRSTCDVWSTSHLARTLQIAARRFGDRPALSRGDDVWLDYRALADRSARIAGGLIQRGLRPGDTVGVVMTTSVDFYPALYGAWHAGLVAVPLNPALSTDEVARALDHARAKLALVTPDRADAVEPLRRAVDCLEAVVVIGSDDHARILAADPVPIVARGADAPAWIFYTSGTTGRPKGAVLTHGNLTAMIAGYLDDVDAIAPGSCIIHAGPMSHGTGMVGLPHVVRGANHVVPTSTGFDPAEILALVARWPRATLCLAPAMLDQLVREVAVVGRASAAGGEVPVAFVRLADGAQVSRGGLDLLCRLRLSPAERPREYVVVDRLPRNGCGKVMKAALRAAPTARAGDRLDTADELQSPWRGYDTVTATGIRIRVATSMEDAEAVRAVLHAAWRTDASEPYFYEGFNDAAALYRDILAPAADTDDVRKLDGLCLVAEDAGDAGRVVGTVSLVFDHARRTVELGRGAVIPEAQGRQVLQQFLGPVRRLLRRVRDYAVISDATTLSRGAGAFLAHMDAPAVALHPSSFTVQRGCVDAWQASLAIGHGDDVARALLDRSDDTGLGRFATAYHLRLPAGRAVYAPCLTARQRVFHAHTRHVLDLPPSDALQPFIERRTEVSDRAHMATRIVIDPPEDVDPGDIVADAVAAGAETVLVQVPCDRRCVAASYRLEAAGATLCGVFPDAFGCWRASYALFVTPDHARRVAESMAILCAGEALVPSYLALAQMLVRSHLSLCHRIAGGGGRARDRGSVAVRCGRRTAPAAGRAGG